MMFRDFPDICSGSFFDFCDRKTKIDMFKNLFICTSLFMLSLSVVTGQAVYVVNSNNDMDDGTCNAAHCSLREAIKASEADGKYSIINFNIGAGPQVIVPAGPLPVINADSTDIGIPAGNPNKVTINFSYRDFGGASFLQINGSHTNIFGLEFTNMLYNSKNDHIIRLGGAANNSQLSSIARCAFYFDNSTIPGTDRKSIDVAQADQVRIDSNYFGTDLVTSGIFGTIGSILVEPSMDGKNFSIRNNYFVTRKDNIVAQGGTGLIDGNLFGAYDTSKSLNFLDPDNAVLLSGGTNYTVSNNFFFGQLISGIEATNLNGLNTISKNRFYSGKADILLTGNSNSTLGIVQNYARNGGSFIQVNMKGSYSLNIDNNDIMQYDNFYANVLDPTINLASYNNNLIRCISNSVVFLDNSNAPKPNAPVITGVNKNQIVGTADPNMFVAVYANPNTGCVKPNTSCQGGALLGIAQANAVGSWMLNAAYPNKNTISAYQYRLGTAYNIYSEFSQCYTCNAPYKESFTPPLCSGSTVTYRGKTYGASNPYDSVVIKGDGVSICDSTFVVNLNIKNATREVRNVNICYNQSATFCNVTLSKNKLIDSCKLQSVNGCDSTIVFVGTERGYSTFNSTICSNASITIGSVTFDINKTQGQVIIPGGSAFGCDSIVDVNLTVKNYAENNIFRTLCPGSSITVKGTVYNAANPKGTETFPNGSSTGCDSIVNIDLKFSNPVDSKSYSICVGDSVLIPSTGKYISANKPLDTLLLPGGSYLGCDSFVYIRVQAMPNSIGNFQQSICRTDTLRLGGQIFHAGKTIGSFLIANGSSNGCDSTVQVSLSVLPDAIGRLDTFTCMGSSLNIYGSIFSETRPDGTIKAPIRSFRGCDTFIMVFVSFIPEKTSVFNPVICRNSSVTVGNQVFTAANPTGVVRLSRPASQGCDSVIMVSVAIAPPISTTFNKSDLKCNAPNSGSFTLNSIIAGDGTKIKVSLDNGAERDYIPDLLYDKLSHGVHTIRIKDVYGCDTVFAFRIDSVQDLSLSLPGDTTINQGSSVTINSTQNFIPARITWTPSTYLSCDNCLNPVSIPDADITYTLTLEDDNGCSISDYMTIRVKVDEADIYMPNIFSPNGDNLNDIVTPEFRFPTRTKVNVYRIFDRWGSLVYERLDGGYGEKFGWDGRFHGRDLNPGVYTYAIQYESINKEPQWRFGDINLIR
ncbi:MAG TPA: gliding motility-associated C-terminal domain-containing protein [Saprospiraceae bacterium]|nr:gliding motility-associated C-terminal domain-containing protein [Saprospiraceae bacterium]